MTQEFIRKGFIAAGVSNILGVVICSKGFTNEVMMTVQPDVMSRFGLLAIMLWGLAYIAVAKGYNGVRWLVAIFAIEKLAYVLSWLMLISSRDVRGIYEMDILAGIFYTIYGINDFIFMLFFAHVFFRSERAPF